MEIFQDRLSVIRRLQPDLRVTKINDNVCRLAGIFHARNGDKTVMSIRCYLEIYPSEFSEPKFWLAESYFPFDIDRHIYSDGQCCLEIWEHWLWQHPDCKIEDVLSELINNFILAQIFFDYNGHFPFGDWRHGFDGIIDAYSEMLKANDIYEIINKIEKIIKTGRSYRRVTPDLARRMKDRLLILLQLNNRMEKQKQSELNIRALVPDLVCGLQDKKALLYNSVSKTSLG